MTTTTTGDIDMGTAFADQAWRACLSALRLDRFLAGELPPRDADEVRAHLASCARCSEASAELRKGREEPLPPLRANVVELRPRRRLPLLAAGLGLAAAASLLVVLLPVRITPAERSKGSGHALAMFVQHGAKVRRAGPGEVVAAGDAVRFAVTTPQAAYVAVLSVDPAGRASVYFPLGARAEAVAAGREVPLPLGTRLDSTVGEERLVGLFCASPVELEPLRASLQAGGASIPEGCQVSQWRFTKR
jgi:anti-sigma factor RsiW